ncbi:MAG TPA: alkaline phosphatase family protein [Vicinamibacterales bacterium]|nr:alkaline phosphatase family protein [Vicinamibacterales bacterium]
MPDHHDPSWRIGERGISRRHFITGVSAGLGLWTAGMSARAKLPKPKHAGIDHIIVLMMENRSFDHFLGWLPAADGRQAGLVYTDSAGVAHPTHPLAPDFQGCGHPDPDHSYAGGRVEYNSGACDGWLRAGANDEFSIGFYGQADLAFLGQSAPAWTVCDRYFAAIMAETFPNRVYQHAAQTDRLDNSAALSTLPTIWDRLAAAGVSANYFFSDVPFLALWGAKYLSISRPFASFLEACATGALPAVSFVDPRFIDEESGTSGDDHPHADIRNGEAFLNTVYTAVTTGPAWPRTALIVNYDEWGGFFEHVPPPAAPIPPADVTAGNQDGLRGFRVPCLIVSPFAHRGFIPSEVFDHTSILRFIEWRWDLDPLTVRDGSANNLADAFNFKSHDSSAPQFAVPPGPFGAACAPTTAARADITAWESVRDLARIFGWPV